MKLKTYIKISTWNYIIMKVLVTTCTFCKQITWVYALRPCNAIFMRIFSYGGNGTGLEISIDFIVICALGVVLPNNYISRTCIVWHRTNVTTTRWARPTISNCYCMLNFSLWHSLRSGKSIPILRSTVQMLKVKDVARYNVRIPVDLCLRILHEDKYFFTL